MRIAGGLALLCLAGWYFWPSPPTSITAGDLWRAYRDDPTWAERRYSGQQVTVSGVCGGMDGDCLVLCPHVTLSDVGRATGTAHFDNVTNHRYGTQY